MRKCVARFIVIIAGLAGLFTGCAAPGKFFPEKPVQKLPYVIVYGKEQCSICHELKEGLDRVGIAYDYKDISDARVRDQVYSRLQRTGLATKKLLIPVVDVSGNIAIRPSAQEVEELYKCSGSKATKQVGEGAAPACSEVTSACQQCA